MFDDGKGHITLKDFQVILYSSLSMEPEDSDILFNKIDVKKDGLITYGNFLFFVLTVLT